MKLDNYWTDWKVVNTFEIFEIAKIQNHIMKIFILLLNSLTRPIIFNIDYS